MKYCIVAYAEAEGTYYLPQKEVYIDANSRDEAKSQAYNMFPEYHEIGVYETE